MNAVLYARVSSERQAEKDLSISAQLKAMRKYASDHEYDIVREFIDEAESARSANRPAFQEMISLARSKMKPFDIVLVWKLSRFARNREDSIIYKSLLRKRGIQVISINEKVDNSPAGKLLEGVIEVIDEFYSENLSQEARRGLRECASRGFFPGGSTPLGYKQVTVIDGRAKRKALEIDEDWAPVVIRIFNLSRQGYGAKEIAGSLNKDGITTLKGYEWSKASVMYILKNDIYTGDLIWPSMRRLKPGEEQIVIKDHHPALINWEDYNEIQNSIANRSPKNVHPKRVASNYLLSGLLYCAKCGKSMQAGTAKSGNYKYYNCYTKLRVNNSACNCKAIGTRKIESAIIEKLKDRVLTEENLLKLLELTNAELKKQSTESTEKIDQLKRQLTEKERKIERLYEAIEGGKIELDDLTPRLRKLKSDAQEFRLKIEELRSKADLSKTNISISLPELRRYVKDLYLILSKGKFFEQRKFLQSFIKKIDYDYPQVTMHYTIPLNLNGNGKNEVLSIGKKSGVDETRTRDLLRDRQAF